MDPNACVTRIISNLRAAKYEDALTGLSEYDIWLSRGGFPADTNLKVVLEDVMFIHRYELAECAENLMCR